MNQPFKFSKHRHSKGFSLIELIIALTMTLMLMGLASGLLSRTFSLRARESNRTDALSLTQASLNVMSREIADSGFGLTDNGIVLADSDQKKLHFRSNIFNNDAATDAPGEDVAYYFDSVTQGIYRYDRFKNPQLSTVVSEKSDLNFQYFDYTNGSATPSVNAVPSANTGRIRITLTVKLNAVQGMPEQSVTCTTDVTLRNSNFILKQY